MTGIFANCISLKEIPDIIEWENSEIMIMNYMFYKYEQ